MSGAAPTPNTGCPFTSEAHARALDERDPLASFRDRFYRRPDQVYLGGNSLGLLSRDAEASTLAALEQWKTLGIGGWLEADPAWFTRGEDLGARTAPLLGAEPAAVVVTGGTTVNLHALVATFYAPTPERRKIVATALDFPSDIYALQAHIVAGGGDPARDLVLVPSRDGETIAEDDLIAAMTNEVALAILPAVLYRSGQLLDIARLAAAARERGISLGFDCAHSVGAVPHQFDRDGVDFAFWCTYKYLNAGPGAVGGLYVNRRHWDKTPALPGWWGYAKERQFDMVFDWESAAGAGAWQIGTPSILGSAALVGSLAMFAEAGLHRLRSKSLGLTDYLIALVETAGLTSGADAFRIVTPRDHDRRGGHVALAHPAGPCVARALKQRGVIPDFRAPDIIRLAPVPLYTGFHDVWRAVEALRGIVENGEHTRGDAGRELVA